jgi:hypothetical protein
MADDGGIGDDADEGQQRRPREPHARGAVEPIVQPRSSLVVIG